MPSKEQVSQLLGMFASASIVGVGFAIGGPIGTSVMAGIGVNLSSSIIQHGSIKLRERWLSSIDGVLNRDIQRALARAFTRALVHLETRLFKQGEINALAANEQESIRVLFKELREQAQQEFTMSLQHAAKDQHISSYLYETPEIATDLLWKRIDETRLLATYDEHVKKFLRKNLLNEVQFWFAEELKADNKESNKAWRAFQRLLLEGIHADVKAVQSSLDLIRHDLKKLDELSSQLDNLRNVIDHRLPHEPLQQELERAIDRGLISAKALFMSGCSVGNRVAIVPTPETRDRDIPALNEFLATLDQIDIRDEAVLQPIVEARDRLASPTSDTLDKEIVKTLIENCLDAMSRVPDAVQAQRSPREFRWFRFGQLLYEIPMSILLGSRQVRPLTTALESLIEQINLPSSLRRDVERFIWASRTRNDGTVLFENANQVAQATFLVLT